LLLWLQYALVFWVLWLLLVLTNDWIEFVAGGVSALIASAIAVAGTGKLVGPAALLAWLPRALPLPGRVLVGPVRVFRASWPRAARGRSGGAFHITPIEARGDDPIAGAERALTTWEQSLAPDAFVVLIEREAGRMRIHRLPPKAPGGQT
jgi:hypothetical protein